MTIREKVRAAILGGDVDGVRALAAEGGDVRLEEDPAELDALMIAAGAGHGAIVELLLTLGASPKQRRRNRFTALHAAAMNGHTDVVLRLLQAGAEVNAQTEPQHYAPIHSAAFAGHVDTVRALLEHGALVGVTTYRGDTPAATARRNRHHELAQLIEASAASPSPSSR